MTLERTRGRLMVWPAPQIMSRFENWFIDKLFANLHKGELDITLPSGTHRHFRAAQPGTKATVALNSWRTVRRVIAAESVGLAKAYIDGDWTTPDLTAFLMLLADNGPQLDAAFAGKFRNLDRLRHWFNDNSLRGSRRNISFHYDLGNDFYKLWLDDSMTYSSALYPDADSSLEQAQQAKLARIADMLQVAKGQKVLEIGCGWGALARHVAEKGASVVGLTLSQEQKRFAEDKIVETGKQSQIEIRLQDYRETKGEFDKIVSIEMLEAVGEAYWPVYFAAVRDRLKAGGRAVIQTITIEESRYEGYRRGTDFIQRFIFPGGMLPTPTIVQEQAAKVGLKLIENQNFGLSYAATLAEWRRRFHNVTHELQALNYDIKFRRMWEYYLCYCEAGFRSGVINVGLFSFEHA